MKSATKELLEELKPYAIPFAMRRFGNPRRDGGYGLIKKFVEECDCVYSYGLGEVAEQNIFDDQLAKLGKKVYLFDDKAEKPFIEHENIIYEKAFIDSSNAYEIILKNKHEKYKNILPPLILLTKEKQKELVDKLSNLKFISEKNLAA